MDRSVMGPGHPLSFLVWGRAVPSALYGYLGWLMLERVIESLRSLGDHPGWLEVVGGPLRLVVYMLFCVIPVILILTRPMPRGRDGRLLVRATAFTGTTLLLVGGAVVPPGPLLFSVPDSVAATATVAIVVMEVIAVYALICLRRNFSIMPEARNVVSRGPYRFVRHPLYAAEIVAALAVVVPAPRLWSTVVLPLFVIIQMTRSVLEERLLTRVLPAYQAYRERTRRLIPFVW
ncbi:MAG: isoprenylcysteine carboxylmethyltransferase family protein [Candidatus Dormibacteria bacterium]